MGRIFSFPKTEFQYSGGTAKKKYMYIEVLPEQEGTLTYNGEEQFPTWKNLDPLKLLIEGEKFAVDAGEHFITVTPMGNFAWPDDTQSPKQIPYTIKRKPILVIPTLKNPITYNGEPQTPEWNDFNSEELEIGGDFQNITAKGTYTATFTPTNNFCWENETFAPKEVEWQIDILKIAKPSAAQTEFTYNAQYQRLTISNFNANYMSRSGDWEGRYDAGMYSATFALLDKESTAWLDGSTNDVIIGWRISRARISVPVSKEQLHFISETYSQYPEWQDDFTKELIDRGIIRETPDQSAAERTHVGEFSTTLTITEPENLYWTSYSDDGITAVKTWQIYPITLPDIVAKDEKVRVLKRQFSIQDIADHFENYDPNYMEIVDPEIDAFGKYTVTFKFKANHTYTNVKWQRQNNGDPQSKTWTIYPLLLGKPFAVNKSLEFNNKDQDPEWDCEDGEFFWLADQYKRCYSIEGTDSEWKVGNYTATFTLEDATWLKYYAFDDHGTQTASADWKITRKVLNLHLNPDYKYYKTVTYLQIPLSEVEYLKTPFYYLEPALVNFDADWIDVSDGTFVPQKVGTYSCRFYLSGDIATGCTLGNNINQAITEKTFNLQVING